MRRALFVIFFLSLWVFPAQAQQNCPATPAVGTNNTTCANTAFVQKQLSATIPTFTPNLPLIGSAGGGFAQGTRSGNTTSFATTTGSLTSGHCSQFDANGNLIDSGAACGSTGGSITVYSVDNICYVDGTHYTTLANALATCTSNVTVIVPSAQSISANITISGNYVKIRCENGAILTYSANISIVFSGTNSGMEDCNLVGPGTSTNTLPPIIFESTFDYFRRNTVTSFGYTSESGIISASGSISNAEISGNQIFGNKDFAINFSTAGAQASIRVTNNYLGNGVWMIPQVGATTPNDWVVANNELDAGSAGLTATSASCMQILGGHVTIVNPAITGNNCHLAANLAPSTGQEGFGVSQLNKFTFTGNTFDARGFTLGGSYSFEFNSLTNGTISGNSGVATDGAAGMICENCRFVTFAGNNQNGWGTTGDGFQFTTTAASAILQQITITGNTAVFPGSGTGGGIHILCNQTSAVCQDFVVTGNSITSDGTAGSFGISLFKSGTNTFSDSLIGPNEIRAPAIGVVISSGVTANCLVAGLNAAATAVSNSGSASSCN